VIKRIRVNVPDILDKVLLKKFPHGTIAKFYSCYLEMFDGKSEEEIEELIMKVMLKKIRICDDEAKIVLPNVKLEKINLEDGKGKKKISELTAMVNEFKNGN